MVIGVTVIVVLALEEDEPRSTPPVRLALDDANDPTTPRIEPATRLRGWSTRTGASSRRRMGATRP